MIPPKHPEVGRELIATDLREQTIVWSARGSTLISLWVRAIEGPMVALYSAVINLTVVLKADSSGHLFDDTGQRVSIFEYLGDYPPEVQ